MTRSQLGASLLLLFLYACDEKKDGPMAGAGKQNPPMKAEAYILTPSPFQESIEVPGNLLSAESVEIHPESAGRIVRLNLAEGKEVAAGYLIAKIDDADLQAQLVKLETQLEIAEQTESRQSKLMAVQGISQQDFDLSVLQVRNLKADIGILKTVIQKTEVRAPFSGKLGLKNISVGAYVTPATAITTLQQTKNLKLDFPLPEKYAQGLREGRKVTFRTTGSAIVHSATVIATAPGLSETNRSLIFRATVQPGGPGLLPGGFATVTVQLAEKPTALMLPAQAVIPQARGKRVIRYANGKADFVDITTGARTADAVEVLSGLNAGDTILLSGLMSIRPNTPVQIGKIQNANQP
jgi:membrane fusion protein (multidrug efflux system)